MEKVTDPGHNGTPDSKANDFVNKNIVVDKVKGLGKVQNLHIRLFTLFHVACQVMYEFYKLRST